MKYVIDLPEKMSMYLNVWKCEDGKCVWTDTYTTSDLKPYTATESYISGLSKGKKEVWGFVNTIYELSDEELYEIFPNGCPYEMTYQEAKTKYEAWRKKKDEIKAGDEVILYDNVKMIVTQIDHGTSIQGVDENGECYESIEADSVKKTGRHYPEVLELLRKLRKNE